MAWMGALQGLSGKVCLHIQRIQGLHGLLFPLVLPPPITNFDPKSQVDKVRVLCVRFAANFW